VKTPRIWLAVACALVAPACLVERRIPEDAARTSKPRIEVRHKNDPHTGAPLREWSLAITPGRAPVKHGKETTWYPNGARHWERDYANGRPAGAWRSFYDSGKPRTECFYGDALVDTQMTFWHANGNVSMQGPARNGVRRGTWRIWYQDGRLAEQGTFVDSLRQGKWLAWSSDGLDAYERTYERNVRASQVRVSSSTPPSVTPPPNTTPANTTSSSAAPPGEVPPIATPPGSASDTPPNGPKTPHSDASGISGPTAAGDSPRQ